MKRTAARGTMGARQHVTVRGHMRQCAATKENLAATKDRSATVRRTERHPGRRRSVLPRAAPWVRGSTWNCAALCIMRGNTAKHNEDEVFCRVWHHSNTKDCAATYIRAPPWVLGGIQWRGTMERGNTKTLQR